MSRNKQLSQAQIEIFQVYLPSALLVVLSWIGPWIDNSVVGSRVTITLLPVLTVVTQVSGLGYFC